MSVVSAIVDPVLNLQGIAAYSLVGGLALGESSLLIGFVLPGETAVFLGGVIASRGAVSLPLMMAVAIAAAIIGDSVGYEIGKRIGPRLTQSRFLAKHQAGLDRSTALLNKHGGKAVLLARFTAFLRAVMPGMAGMAKLPYRTFLAWNAAGAIVWAGGLTLLGHAAGDSYSAIEDWTGRASLFLAIAVALGVLGVLVRRRIAARRALAYTSPPSPTDYPVISADHNESTG